MRKEYRSSLTTFAAVAGLVFAVTSSVPQTTDKGDKQVAAEYREKTPYRPLSDRGCNGRNVCLGCPGRRPGPPSFGP